RPCARSPVHFLRIPAARRKADQTGEMTRLVCTAARSGSHLGRGPGWSNQGPISTSPTASHSRRDEGLAVPPAVEPRRHVPVLRAEVSAIRRQPAGLQRLGFGTGWNEFRTNVNISNSAYDGNLTWRYGGVRLFFRASY